MTHVLARSAAPGVSAAPAGPAVAPPPVHDVLRAPGRPLDAATRGYMEPRFGHSFADVRVHDDLRAAASARAVGARAYAVGRDLVFGRGEYRPATAEGRRLLAHELAHVVQQRGATAALQPRLEVGPSGAPEEREADRAAEAVAAGGKAPPMGRAPAVLRRVPGQDARESWDALVTHSLDPDEAERRAPVEDAIGRFLRIAEGARLMNQLWALFCDANGCRSAIDVRFVDQLPPGSEGATGQFSPDRRRAARYVVHVRYTPTRPGTLWTQWPTSGPPLVTSHATEGPSQMGETLFHEMLHVWFVNARRGRIAHTGHGDAAAGEYEQEFVDRLQVAAAEMQELEGVIREEEAAARRAAEERARQAAPPAPPADAPAREARPSGPPPVGLAAGAHVGAGGFSGRGWAFQSIVGADLVLNVLGGLRLGARGIYTTPEHLFVGPSVGYRFLEGGRVERPIFFDLEAGVLFELSPAAAGRVSDVVSGVAGAGIGQEYGTDGARFWWRAGGMVIVTDRPDPGGGAATVGGGGHLGAGVSF